MPDPKLSEDAVTIIFVLRFVIIMLCVYAVIKVFKRKP